MRLFGGWMQHPRVRRWTAAFARMARNPIVGLSVAGVIACQVRGIRVRIEQLVGEDDDAVRVSPARVCRHSR